MGLITLLDLAITLQQSDDRAIGERLFVRRRSGCQDAPTVQGPRLAAGVDEAGFSYAGFSHNGHGLAPAVGRPFQSLCE
jgi:hypothetical protein